MITPTLEDVMKRRTYKLKYVWNYCLTCEAKGEDPVRPTNVLIHSFNDDPHNINQYHGQLGTTECHIEKPMKVCSQCDKVYSYDEYSCSDCNKIAEELTILELQLEKVNKDINKINRFRSRGKMTQDETLQEIAILENTARDLEKSIAQIRG